MSRAVKIFSGVETKGPAALNTSQVVDFPLDPLIGTFVTKDDIVWVYQTDNGVSSWQPYRGKARTYVHTQDTASNVWTIGHNLGSTDLWYQIKDDEGNIVFANNVSIDLDNSFIEFTEPVKGSVILLAPTTYGIMQTNTAVVPPLKPLLIYYGYPIAYKGYWNAQTIIDEIATNYKVWVCGATYHQASHEVYATTQEIIAGVRARGVRVYGYVAIGTSNSVTPTVPAIQTAVDEWVTIGVDGIFLDEFGFDYGSDRVRQNQAVDWVHSKGLPVCANAWVIEEFACDNVSELSYSNNDWRYVRFVQNNPTNIAIDRRPGDSYLIENFGYSHNGPANVFDSLERSLLTQQLAEQKEIELWAMSVFGETTPGTVDTTKLGNLTTMDSIGEYISAMAYLYDITIVGSGGYSFGSNGSPLWAPLYNMPTNARKPIAQAVNNYSNKTGIRYFGDVSVTVTNTGTTQSVLVSGDVTNILGQVKQTPITSEQITNWDTAYTSLGDISAALDLILGA